MDVDDETDELDVAAKGWNRVVDAASKVGYREGAQDGSASVIQEGFDLGYKESFKTAFLLGKYQGLATALLRDIQHPVHIKQILDKIELGNCYVCSEEFQSIDEKTYFVPELLNHQKKHSEIAIKTLHEYLEPLLKELKIDISHMKNEF